MDEKANLLQGKQSFYPIGRVGKWYDNFMPDVQVAMIQRVMITDDTLTVDLSDGRTISVPLAWYPRLLHGSMEERNRWRLIGNGEGIHWEDLDEDISADNLVYGQLSGESKRSFKHWLEERNA